MILRFVVCIMEHDTKVCGLHHGAWYQGLWFASWSMILRFVVCIMEHDTKVCGLHDTKVCGLHHGA